MKSSATKAVIAEVSVTAGFYKLNLEEKARALQSLFRSKLVQNEAAIAKRNAKFNHLLQNIEALILDDNNEAGVQITVREYKLMM